MNFIKKTGFGILLCFAIAIPSWFLGKQFPLIGGPVIAILIGMALAILIKDKTAFMPGITFVSKKILQLAVVLLGFGLNLNVIAKTGKECLPIIISTITVSLVLAFLLQKVMKIPGNTATLVGVGSCICGGSAIAATAPVIEADDHEVAQSISVIFLFNVLAAIIFPQLGVLLGFSGTDGTAFGIFAGTAVNDTSSVTAAASTWDSMFSLGCATLDTAVTVKLTRTLAIIPITLVLAFMQTKKAKHAGTTFSFKKIFPFFILYFIGASVITTIATNCLGVPTAAFDGFKELSKFFIVLAMAAIGLNSNIIKLIKTGGKPILMGALCWIAITGVSIGMQHVMHIW